MVRLLHDPLFYVRQSVLDPYRQAEKAIGVRSGPGRWSLEKSSGKRKNQKRIRDWVISRGQSMRQKGSIA